MQVELLRPQPSDYGHPLDIMCCVVCHHHQTLFGTDPIILVKTVFELITITVSVDGFMIVSRTQMQQLYVKRKQYSDYIIPYHFYYISIVKILKHSRFEFQRVRVIGLVSCDHHLFSSVMNS